ncbi:MAG: hypothetical protein ABI873_14190 [Marmoricola sp.]
MNDRQTEHRLEKSLRQQADRFDAESGPQIGMDRVVREVSRIRRRRTTAAVVAAVAVVAVVAPAAVLVGRHLGGPESRNVAPVGPSPTVTTSPGPKPLSKTLSLARIAAGPAPQISYANGHTLHNPDGSTSRLPASTGRVAEFTSYHGGALVVNADDDRLLKLDGRGSVVSSGPGGSIALTIDGTFLAYQVGARIYTGGASSMGNGNAGPGAKVDAPGGALVGFLSDLSLVYNGRAGSVRTLGKDAQGNAVVGTVPGLATADATSYVGDLVAGTTSLGRGEVVSATSGKSLWTSPEWRPLAFSTDGRYVAATSSTTVGAPQRLAILDARTGKQVTYLGLVTNGLTLGGGLAWEDDDQLLFVTYAQGKSDWAILRLAPDGTLNRASEISSAPGDSPPFAFATRP